MGLFSFIFPKQTQTQSKQAAEFFKTFNGYAPVFTSWNGSIYESELVRAAIDAKARAISKLEVTIQGSARPKLQTKLKAGPNRWQTWSQFLYRLDTILELNNTAFIVPVLDMYGDTTGYYPVLPAQCEIVQYDSEPFLRYRFNTGETAAIELTRCGIMTKFQYRKDFFGDDNGALTQTMNLMNIQNQGIEEGVKSAATFRFMASMTNFTKDKDLAKERLRFNEENLRDGDGGIILFPNTFANVQQINSKPFVIDAEQMNIIKANVFDYFGVNEDVLQNKCFGDNWSAFYEGAIEPFAIQFSDVMTKMTFTPVERTNGALIHATSNRLQYMSNADKLNVSTQLLDRGIISINDSRAIWNLPPVENGDVRIIRGEYYNADEKVSEETPNEPTEPDKTKGDENNDAN